jgi:hypothetical protein
MKFAFKGGPRAPLSTPTACGSYAASADFSPRSAPSTADARMQPQFTLSEGCAGRGFAPAFSSGTVNSQSNGFSAFSTTFGRTDQDQTLGSVQITTPPGLLGIIRNVTRCGDTQADAGTCPAASQIGTTTVVAGPGSQPFTVPEAGQPSAPVFLTEGYKGAPFGLSVVVPAIAGPFNLGTVVVRAAISVDPTTAQVTITSDPLPTILDGVPLQVRSVNVTIDNSAFIFNATNCESHAVNGVIFSAEGAAAPVASHYQAANCANLPFKPTLTSSTGAHASKAQGAGFTLKISAKGGPQPGGGEANIKSLKLEIPKLLPSRNTTLNKACLAATFEANPAACPVGSDIGTAKVVTPVFANPLNGPAYLVSHGSEAFPDIDIVLQGEGVKINLVAHTDIKKGVTSSFLEEAPDAPISSFDLTLPTGKFSLLTATPTKAGSYNQCGRTLNMPTKIIGQNGAVISQTVKIGVTECPKAKAKKTVKKKKKSGKKRAPARKNK